LGQPESVAPADDQLDHRHWMLPVLVCLIGTFLSILSSSIINVAMASIMAVFSTDTQGVQWVSTAYSLAMAMIIPMSGWLGDKLGLRKLYIVSLVVFVAGSTLCAFSWSLESLIAARVIQAAGGGILSPVVMAMIYRLVPRKQIGTAMGIMGMALFVAPAIGPTLGGWMVQYIDWRWIFMINLPLGIVGVLLALMVVPDFAKVAVGKFDVPGAVTAALGFAGLLFVLSKGNTWGWTSETTILTLVASLGMLVVWVLVELWSPAPLLDLKIFAIPSFSLANIAVGVTTIGMFAGITLETSMATITWWLVLRGVAMGICMMPIQTAALNEIPGPLVSRASSLSNLIRNVASSFGIAIMTVLMTDRNVFHAARLREAFTADNTTLGDFLAANPATGPTALATQVAKASYVLSLQDIFLFASLLILLSIIPALFLVRHRRAQAAAARA
jgi:multidrug resistance protein